MCHSWWGCGYWGGCGYMSGGIWQISVPFPQFYCEPKTTLEKNDYNVIYEANTGFILGLRMWHNALGVPVKIVCSGLVFNSIGELPLLCVAHSPQTPSRTPHYHTGFEPPVYWEGCLEDKQPKFRSVLKPSYPDGLAECVEADNTDGKSITAGPHSSRGWEAIYGN